MRSKQKQRAGEEMSWISRKLFLYNVTIGLYAMDWWERYLFNSIVLVLMWLICYTTTKSMWHTFDNYLKSSMQVVGTRNCSMIAGSLVHETVL